MFQFNLMLVFFVFIFCSCKKEIGKTNYGDYPYEVGAIIRSNCAVSGCHNSKSYLAASQLNLETWTDLFKGSSTGASIIPYSSRFSSLCYFINTYADLGTQSLPTMPLNRKALSYNEVKLLKDWIDQGAPNINGNIKWHDHTPRKKLYAVNQGCSAVTILDSETQLQIGYVEVGTKFGSDAPHQVRVSPDGKYWYVIFLNNNLIQKFDCNTDRLIGQIPLTPFAAGTGITDALNWNTFVISKDGKRAYAASLSDNGALAAIDLENMNLQHYMAFVYNPHGIALNADESKIYVTAQVGNYIMEIDTAFNARNNISLINGLAPSQNSSLDPHDIILSPIKNDLWITCQKSNEVRVYNLTASKVNSIIPVGNYPQEIVYSKSTDEYFVTCLNDTIQKGTWGSVTKMDAKNQNLVSKMACGYQPHGIAVDENSQLIYVLSRNQSSKGPPAHHSSQCTGRNGFVNFIDLNSFKILDKKYELSVDPYFISIQP